MNGGKWEVEMSIERTKMQSPREDGTEMYKEHKAQKGEAWWCRRAQ